MKSIFEFKKGDKITRIIPTKESNFISYMGDELIFIGIINGQIYFKIKDVLMNLIFGEDYLFKVNLHFWSEGWDYYIDPKTLLENKDSFIDNNSIKWQIEKAVKEENYELAEELKTKLI